MRILITRPQPSADALAELCAVHNINHYVWPSTCIKGPPRPQAIHAAIQRYQPTDLVIFVSPSAVQQTLPILRPDEKQILSACQLCAVGAGTANLLVQNGFGQVIYPKGSANSEALLSLPVLQTVGGKTIWIMRGQTGRELLASTLRRRGAIIQYITCYQRQQNRLNIDSMIRAWQMEPFDIVISTSLTGLQYLWQAIPQNQRHLLQATRVTVTSKKMLTWAKRQGIDQTIMLADMRNHHIMARLIGLRESI